MALALGSYAGPNEVKWAARYVVASVERAVRSLAYEVYVTDALYLLGRGQGHGQRFAELAGIAKAPDFDPEAVADRIVAEVGAEE